MYFQPEQKRFLSSFNPVLLGFFAFLLIVFRSTSEGILPYVFRQWDVLFPFAIYFGQRRSWVEGILMMLLLSHYYSLASSAPFGVFSFYYLIFFVIARLLSVVIYASSWFSILGLMFVMAVLGRLVLPIIAGGFGHAWPVLALRNWSLMGIFLNTFLGLLLYWSLGIIDKLTYKAPRINIELGEDSL